MSNEYPPLDDLKHNALPQVAAVLRAASARILTKWRDIVVQTLPQADELTRKQFENSVPKLLEEIADALAAASDGPTDKLVSDAPVHGETRYHQHFSIDELLIEYQLLRRVILEELIVDLARPLSLAESVSVNAALDVVKRKAAVEFCKHQAEALTNEANIMSKYLSFLSHDLRGGLNGSILMIEVLKRDLANEPKFAESISDLDMMRRSMLDTVATMDRFLHAERLRRGKMPVKIGSVDLNQLFRQLLRSLAYQVQDQNTKVDVDVTVPGLVKTDGDVINIVLTNLVGNAIKYSDGKPVKLSAESIDGIVRISVIDNGRGIASEKLANLFAPFERGETYGQRGTGLGLTIARQAAELIGAKVDVKSEVGKGTTFTIDLPNEL